MRSDYDIATLFYSRDDVLEKDVYRGEAEPRLDPLLLDTVMPLSSQSRLLRLPTEILAKIVRLVAEDDEALKQLALVNSDCRGLARTCQFSEVTFDFSANQCSLLNRLTSELDPNYKGAGIKDFIRKFTFDPNPYHVRMAHKDIEHMEHFPNGASGQELARLKSDAADNYHRTQLILATNINAMRNLETLIWNDKFPLPEEWFQLISNSTAHNLTLSKVVIPNGWCLSYPSIPSSWPLRSLYLDVRLTGAWDDKSNNGGQRGPNPSNVFFNTLFKLCSPTLESLAWETWNSRSWEPISLAASLVSFLRLRHLRIKPGPGAIDESTMASLLSAPLRSLKLKHQSVPEFENLIKAHTQEPYQNLEQLVLAADVGDEALIAEFIHKHNRLQKLSVTQSYDGRGCSTHFDRVLIPGLGNGRFNHLRSLSIQWGGRTKDDNRPHGLFDIPPESLSVIGELTTLEQLCLRCGEKRDEFNFETMVRYDIHDPQPHSVWLIDHGNMRAHLQNLKNLKLLAIRGDTYCDFMGVAGASLYYNSFTVSHEDLAVVRAHPELEPFVHGQREWEIAHLARMLDHAKEYLTVLPKLEWMLCGQRPMEFIRNAEGVTELVPIGFERDECKTYLARVFGLSSKVEEAHMTE
ncbi:hypothetical protein H9Q70_014373 [Fusarium xylarioides]|nr:hypothetical protein H9Q70_014373 [Fusarium xylarioides]KAG5767460.1 hypothetical protein H9Q73_014222 [Fusarium xylarioides]